MRSELDFLVPPLRRPVPAGDETHAMETAKVAVDKGVSGLGLLRRTDRQPEMPTRIVRPWVTLEIGVLIRRGGLCLTPLTAPDVLT